MALVLEMQMSDTKTSFLMLKVYDKSVLLQYNHFSIGYQTCL